MKPRTKQKRLLGILMVLTMVLTLIPLTAFADDPTYITSVEISGAYPIIGYPCNTDSISVTTTPAEAADIKNIVWYNDIVDDDASPTEVFREGGMYHIIVQLEAREGYSFEYGEDTSPGTFYTYTYTGTATVNGERAKVAAEINGNDTDMMLVCGKSTTAYESPAANITSVAIDNVKDPVADQYCSIEGITLTTDPGDYTWITDMYWYDETDNIKKSSTETFTEGHDYHICFEVQSEPGYAFKSDAAYYLSNVTINGENAVTLEKEEYYNTYIRFTGKTVKAEPASPAANTYIPVIDITNVQVPVAGQPCTTDGIKVTTDPADAAIADIYWWGGKSAGRLSSADKFIEGYEYAICIDLIPKEGYAFELFGPPEPDSPKPSFKGSATINGEMAEIAEMLVKDDTGIFVFSRMGTAKAEGGGKLTPAYKFTIGQGGTFTKASGKGLVFKADGPLEKCTGIKIDGRLIAPSNYKLESGSTIVTLKSEYLETLSEGDHTITVVYGDEEVTAGFKVAAAPKTDKTGKVVSAETGDNSRMSLWIALAIAACGGIGAVWFILNKRSSNK